VDLGQGVKAIMVHMTVFNRTKGDDDLMQFMSYDDGVTWQDPVRLNHFFQPNHFPMLPGPSVGIQSLSGNIYFYGRIEEVNNTAGFLY